MKCDICDMPAVINDLCQGCYDDLAKGGDDALRAAEMFQLRIADIKIESNKLHDALERNSEVIKALLIGAALAGVIAVVASIPPTFWLGLLIVGAYAWATYPRKAVQPCE